MTLAVDDRPVQQNSAAAGTPSAAAAAFGLFVAANVVLFIRPGDVNNSLAALPLYELLMIACALVAVPKLLWHLKWQNLRNDPVTLLVIGLLPAVMVSHWREMNSLALQGIITTAKLIVYYLLLVAVIDSQARLLTFLRWLALLTVGAAALPLLQHYGLVQLETLAAVRDRMSDAEAGVVLFERMRGAGIFHDPNDLCHIAAVGVLLCLYVLSQSRRRLTWVLGIIGLVVLGQVIVLTQSRGGLLALLGGLGVLVLLRYGWRKASIIGVLGLMLLPLVVSGRQGEWSVRETTGQERIQLWSDALWALRSSPVVGIGQGNFALSNGLVPHNSFLQAYAELGLLGGMLFLGVFYVAGWRLWNTRPTEPQMWPVRTFLLAILVTYAVGMLTLSRGYEVPTYTVAGLAAVFPLVAGGVGRTHEHLLRRLLILSVVFLGAMHLFVKAFVHR